MGGADASAPMQVAVACSAVPGQAVEVQVSLPSGATVADAVRASGLLDRFGAGGLDSASLGVWGRPCAADTPLAPGDRVELYRPLAMDPKDARRLRAARRPLRSR